MGLGPTNPARSASNPTTASAAHSAANQFPYLGPNQPSFEMLISTSAPPAANWWIWAAMPARGKKGLLKLEGKEYIVKDGDVLVIRHG
jgi:hypothetical protein